MSEFTTAATVVPAAPDEVYRVLLDPTAIARWRVPNGMTALVHEFEPRVGGRFRISLTYDDGSAGKSTGHTDTYGGHFAELVPDQRVVEVLAFETDDPQLAGDQTVTTTLAPQDGGTLVGIQHDDLPPGVSPSDNEAGTRMALMNLRRMFDTQQS